MITWGHKQACVQLLQPATQRSLRWRELLLRLRRPLPDRLVVEPERAPEAARDPLRMLNDEDVQEVLGALGVLLPKLP